MELHRPFTPWQAGHLLASWGPSGYLLSAYNWQYQLLGFSYCKLFAFMFCPDLLNTSVTLVRSLEILRSLMWTRSHQRSTSPLLCAHNPSHHHHNGRCWCHPCPCHIHSIHHPICFFLCSHGLWTLSWYHWPHSLPVLTRTHLRGQDWWKAWPFLPGFSTAIVIQTAMEITWPPLQPTLRHRVIGPLINLPVGTCQLRTSLAG